MRTVKLSSHPTHAPADFRSLADRVVTRDGDGLFETWHGSGRPSAEPCGHCENVAGNLQIYGNWGFSYPNGNSWDDAELLCGACQRFTVIYEFTEG
ncbi:MAG: hypothetical protein EP330_14085 [Deltaproteobacteria bacterium]|nr:MAG: hypothetical protein EP330_14085 [Deltaproteobacteria bacterium]